MLIKRPLNETDRQFARRFGEVLREVTLRLDPDSGDPEGHIIREGAERLHAALGILASSYDVSLYRAVSLALVEEVEDPRTFMDSEIGYDLLDMSAMEVASNQWHPRHLVGRLEAQYPRVCSVN